MSKLKTALIITTAVVVVTGSILSYFGYKQVRSESNTTTKHLKEAWQTTAKFYNEHKEHFTESEQAKVLKFLQAAEVTIKSIEGNALNIITDHARVMEMISINNALIEEVKHRVKPD